MLAYLSWAIMNKKVIPSFIGIITCVMSVSLVIVYFYFYKNETNTDKYKPLTYYDPSEYEIIGGVSGLGWIN
jgi:uncharacterized membrane protein